LDSSITAPSISTITAFSTPGVFEHAAQHAAIARANNQNPGAGQDG
jgi:hypothetical protein